MKRLISIMLSVMMLLSLAACGSKTSEDASDAGDTGTASAQTVTVAGAYRNTYEESYDGETITFDMWVYLKDNGTGYLLMQDLIPITWDDTTISYADYGDISYNYTVDGDVLTLSMSSDGNDFEDTYTRCTDEDEIPDFDGMYTMMHDDFTATTPEDAIGSWNLNMAFVYPADSTEPIDDWSANEKNQFCYLEIYMNDEGAYTGVFHDQYSEQPDDLNTICSLIETPINLTIQEGAPFAAAEMLQNWHLEVTGEGDTVNPMQNNAVISHTVFTPFSQSLADGDCHMAITVPVPDYLTVIMEYPTENGPMRQEMFFDRSYG